MSPSTGGDYEASLKELKEANQDDPFIQGILGAMYGKLGVKQIRQRSFIESRSDYGPQSFRRLPRVHLRAGDLALAGG